MAITGGNACAWHGARCAGRTFQPTIIERIVDWLAEALAAGVESGAIAGEVLRDGDSIYYYHPGGYDTLTAIVMVRP